MVLVETAYLGLLPLFFMVVGRSHARITHNLALKVHGFQSIRAKHFAGKALFLRPLIPRK